MVYLHIGVSCKSAFVTNKMHTLNTAGIPVELRPKGNRTVNATGCGNNWDNANAAIFNVLTSGMLELCSSVNQPAFRVSGEWSV